MAWLRPILRPGLIVLVFALGCSSSDRPAKPAQNVGRAAGVKAKAKAGAAFCEKTWPAGARKFARPAERPLPEGVARPEQEGAWTWVNLWATWCVPCIEEMALLGSWRDALAREGQPFKLQLWTIDAPSEAAALKERVEKGLPGPVRWLASEAQAPFFSHLGVSAGTPIPIHALVDPAGDLRCVRVGAIHGRDYAQIKQLLSGG